MIYRFLILILTLLLLSVSACAPVMINGEVSSDKGTYLGPVSMAVYEHRAIKSYTVKTELPDETVFNGKMNFGEKEIILFSGNGVSMKCQFDMKDPANGFAGGGTGLCTTSDGQKIKVKF